MTERQAAPGQAAPGQAAPATGSSLLDQIVARTSVGKNEAVKQRSRDLLEKFIGELCEGHMTVSPDTEVMINERIAQIDMLLSRQLDAILHNEKFKTIEASWRGLKYLVDRTEITANLKIRVLNVTKDDLIRDFRSGGFDQSAIFQKVYEDEYGTHGGDPFAALVGDFEFGKLPQDVELLEKMSQVAAAAHAPFLTAAAPDLLNLESFNDLGAPRDISKIFDSTEFAKWKSFRESEDSRYVGLCLPHVLMRLPYGPETNPVDGFVYREAVDGSDHDKYLWGNAAYALATRLTEAFDKYGWCAAIRGVEGGGLVEGLPTHNFRSTDGDVALKCPTEIAITDRREKELADHGFIPLVHCKGSDYAAFFSVQSAQKPQLYSKDAANASARLSAQLPYLLAVSRFAHYLKAMMRDRIGSFMSRSECERFLNEWINLYAIADDDAPAPIKAKNPLREARVDVTEVPGKPGAYRAVAYLRPHYQLDEVGVALSLVADLPQPAQR